MDCKIDSPLINDKEESEFCASSFQLSMSIYIKENLAFHSLCITKYTHHLLIVLIFKQFLIYFQFLLYTWLCIFVLFSSFSFTVWFHFKYLHVSVLTAQKCLALVYLLIFFSVSFCQFPSSNDYFDKPQPPKVVEKEHRWIYFRGKFKTHTGGITV